MTTIFATPPAQTPGSAVTHDGPPQLRIRYFDWLRALAVLGVIIYHTLLPFARSMWLIPNGQQGEALLAVVSLLEAFGLAVLFLIAGACARFALQSRSIGAFLTERALRLLVPFAVGAVVVVPVTSYIIGLHLGTVSGPFLAFLAAYPRTVWEYNITTVGLSPEILTYVGMHLWFLAWLFICSVLGLPIFAFLSSSAGRSFIDACGRLARWRGATLLLAVPITLPRLALFALSPPEQGWSLEAFAWYFMVFVAGYLLFTDERFSAAVRRDLRVALFVGVLGSFGLLAANFVHWADMPQTYDATLFLRVSLLGTTGWAWTLTFLGIGMRAGFMRRPLPAFAREAALPAYVLHFPIVLAISSLVVRSPLEFGAKILANALLGVAATLLVTAGALTIPVLRPLLGLRRLQRVHHATGQLAA